MSVRAGASLGWAALAVLDLAGCARIEPPPGGPPDDTPPALVSVHPDSLMIARDYSGAVVFGFDEVISEGSQPSMGLGTSDLERLIVLSPSDNVPRVRWKRNTIEVEPKEGWQLNRVYRIELLPGIVDLQRNRLDSGTVITFSTGAPLPTARLSGSVVDWQAGRLARLALVDALLLPDSLRYRAFTDSTGRFSFGPLPAGEYLVSGVIDQNRNLRRDGRDNYDTVRVNADSSADVGTIWTFPRDTIGPRLQTASAVDSLAVDLGFNQPLDPYQQVDTTHVRVFSLPDSSPVTIASLRPRAVDDSVQRSLRAAQDTAQEVDTTRAALDSARQAAADRLKQGPPGAEAERAILANRPALFDHLILRMAGPLLPGRQYTIETRGIRNVNRVAADSRQPLRVPERPPAAPDSVRPVRPDSLRPDSAPPP